MMDSQSQETLSRAIQANSIRDLQETMLSLLHRMETLNQKLDVVLENTKKSTPKTTRRKKVEEEKAE